jgi:hypothetical protein
MTNGDGVNLPADFTGFSKLPAVATDGSIEQGIDLSNYTVNVDNGMAGKYSRQTVRQVAGQTFSGAPCQAQFEDEFIGTLVAEGQSDIVGTFGRVPEKGVKKLIGCFGREKLPQGFFTKHLAIIIQFHSTGLFPVVVDNGKQAGANKLLH